MKSKNAKTFTLMSFVILLSEAFSKNCWWRCRTQHEDENKLFGQITAAENYNPERFI